MSLINFQQMQEGVREAKRVLDNADDLAQSFAEILDGRLRKCSPYVLRRLKRQLKDFNISTGRWK